MTRILVSCSSPLKENGAPTFVCMYEGFFKSLADEGNQVMIINPAFLVTRHWNGSNELLPHIEVDRLVEAVKNFAPEVTFAFNHTIPRCVEAILECPIILWDADSIQFFNDKEVVRANFDRYHFFCFANSGMENMLQFGVPRNRIFLMPSATGVKAEAIAQDKNISFIGTMFQNHMEVQDFFQHYPDGGDRDRLIELIKLGYDHLHDDFIQERREQIEKYIPLGVLFSMYSPQKRIETLNAISDLGLTLYGISNWYEASKFFPDIAAAYNPTLVYSLKHNQDIYNASKLCLNICHAQVVDGYAWRVLDIMASNGVLFSDYSPGIANLLKGYIDLPMYETAGGARDLAKRLLADEPHRQAIVAASQRCIEDSGLWRHRFSDMEKVLSLQLLYSDKEKGSLTFLDPDIYFPKIGSEKAAMIKAIFAKRIENAKPSDKIIAFGRILLILIMPAFVTELCKRYRSKMLYLCKRIIILLLPGFVQIGILRFRNWRKR